MAKCENCEIEHESVYGSGRFCCTKCARSFSTKLKRSEINQKVSKSLSGRETWIKGKSFVERTTRNCPSCNFEFKVKFSSGQQYCSRQCARIVSRKAYSKLTKDQLQHYADKSKSVNNMLKLIKAELKIGSMSGSSWHAVCNLIEIYKIDVSHFLGKKANSGVEHTGGPEKITNQNISTYKRRASAYVLRRVLNEVQRPYNCEGCGNSGIWCDKPLQLQVDHIDGDKTNNNVCNLRYMCPNCHVQTSTWGNKKRVDVAN